jgi:hypothetical protein
MNGVMPCTPCSLEPLSNTCLAREARQTSLRSSTCLAAGAAGAAVSYPVAVTITVYCLQFRIVLLTSLSGSFSSV